MRKRLAILLALSLTAIMTFGVVGSGALFEWRGTATQVVTVGTLNVALTSVDGTFDDATDTLTCNPFTLPNSYGYRSVSPMDPIWIPCGMTLASTGSYDVSTIVIQMTVTSSKPDTHLDRFFVKPTGFPLRAGNPALQPLNVAAHYTLGIASLPATIGLPIAWGNFDHPAVPRLQLDNVDLGSVITISYTLTTPAQ